MRHLRLAVLLVAATLVVAGCGIAAQREPVVVEGAALPPEQAPAEAVEEEPDATVVYLVAGDRLRPVPRSRRPTAPAAVAALLEGPRETEAAAGLRSAIPAGTQLLDTSIAGGELLVDLSEEFTSIVGEEHLLALAQLVFTATGTGLVDRVSIAIEGTAVPVARADGQLSTGPVSAEDYAPLAG